MKKIMICLLALLVLITMTLSFVACGDEETTPSEDSGTKDTDGSVTGSASGGVSIGGSNITDESTGGDDTTDTSVGGDDTTDTSVGGSDTTDTSVGGSDTTDTSVGGDDTTDSSTGGDNPDDGGNDNPGDGGDDTVKACTHESTSYTLIDLGDIETACGGGVYAEKCMECEKIVTIYEDTLITLCVYESGTDGKCTECGLEVTSAEAKEGCTLVTTYNIALGDTKIVDGVSIKRTEHSLTYEMVKNEDFACDVTVAYEKCNDCTYSVTLAALHEGEELNVTNENGTKESSCDACGYKAVVSVNDAPECAKYREFSLYNGEILLFNGKKARESEEHSWSLSATMLGDTCDDGLIITKNCIECGVKEYETATHHYTTEEKMDIAELSSCGGYILLEKCVACEEIISVAEKPSACYFKLVDAINEDDSYTNEYECVDCGINVLTTYSSTGIGSCETLESEKTKISKGEDIILSVAREYVSSWHYEGDYIYTYELIGESCLDGVLEIGVCEYCGHTEIRELYDDYHRHENSEKIELDILCGGYVREYSCLCGEEKDIVNYGECFAPAPTVSEEVIDGITFTVETTACGECGTEQIVKKGERLEGCDLYSYEQIVFILNGEAVYDSGICTESIYTDHDTEKRTIALGPSCDLDGVLIKRSCGCGYISYETKRYHDRIAIEEIDITAYGACGGKIVVSQCPCDEKISYAYYSGNGCSFEDEEAETEDGRVITSVCCECGFTVITKEASTVENCERIGKEEIIYTKDGEVIYRYLSQDFTEPYHRLETTYRLLADSCYEGVYLTEACMDCDYKETEAYYSCNAVVDKEIYFEDLGICGGYYRYFRCACGDNEFENYSISSCSLVESEPTYETIDGISYKTVISTCEICGVVETRVEYTAMDGCDEMQYYKYFLIFNGETLVDDMIRNSFIRAHHEMEVSSKLLGQSCEDGIREIQTCTKCGAEFGSTYDYHKLYDKHEINDIGDCYHLLIYEECLCQAEHNLTIGFFDMGEDGKYACDKCGLRIDESEEATTESCKKTVTKTRTVYIGSEYQFEIVDVEVYDIHSFKSPALIEEDGREIIISNCQACNFELVQEIFVITSVPNEWGEMAGTASFTVNESGVYTLYTTSKLVDIIYISDEQGNMVNAFYPENDRRAVGTVELEKDVEYKYETLDYNAELDLSVAVVLQGEYSFCTEEADEDSFERVTLDGKYRVTICAHCHMVLDIQEMP